MLKSNGPQVVRKSTMNSTKHKIKASLKKQQQRHQQTQHGTGTRFNNVVSITEIPTHRIYTFEERLACWYTKSEYRCFGLQESIRKLKASTESRRSDLMNDARYKNVLDSQDDFQPIGDKKMPTTTTTKSQDAFSAVFDAFHQSNNQRLDQVNWLLRRHEQLPNSMPNSGLNASTPIWSTPAPKFQTKDGKMILQNPLVYPNNMMVIRPSTPPMEDPNSPVARGA